MPLPVVAIVGRPNVGKSSLFNWLAGRRISIVDPTAGVTRDRVSSIVEAGGRFFELTDTGGMGIVDRDDLIGRRRAADPARHRPGGRDPVRGRRPQRAGRRSTRTSPTGCVRSASRSSASVNKCDTDALALQAAEFYRFGYQPVIPGQRRAEPRAGTSCWPRSSSACRPPTDETAPAEVALKLAIVGRRNAGKSTFINGLAEAERVIVSEMPGTTRDSVDVRFERDGKTFVAIDTAGVRHRSSLASDIEFYSLARAERSIRRADVVLLFFDAAAIDQPGRQAARRVHPRAPQAGHLRRQQVGPGEGPAWRRRSSSSTCKKSFPMLDYVPIAFITAKDGQERLPRAEPGAAA